MPQPLTQTLSCAEDYFVQVLSPNCETYFSTNRNFASIANIAMALYHFHEWLFHQYRSEFAKLPSPLTSAHQVWKAAEDSNRKFGYVRDVVNASKHVEITKQPSTGVDHIKYVGIIDSPYGAGPFGAGNYGGSNVVCDDSGQAVSFDSCVSELYEYWKVLLIGLTGKTYV